MTKISSYYLPATVREAASRLSKPGAAIIAGSTLAARNLPAGTMAAVDLRRLPLKYIKADAKGLHLGACATFSDILDSKTACAWAGGILRSAAFKVSSQLIRNMATVGGNIARPMPYNHLPPVFAALDAKVLVAAKGKTAYYQFGELAGKPLAGTLGKKALIVEVLLPAATKNMRGVFEKFSKAPSMWESYALVAAALAFKNGVCSGAGLALGAAVPRVVRLAAVEAALIGSPVTETTAGAAVSAAPDGLELGAQREYKRELLPVLIRRAIIAAAREDK